MNFTCFLNSRGRPKQLIKCIKALEANTKYINLTEIIITIDNDDKDTLKIIKNLINRKTFSFKIIIGDRPKNLTKSYNNMAKIANGKYLLVLNDDAEIETKDWDAIALEKISNYKELVNIKDDIFLGVTTDNSIDKPDDQLYPSFPIISKEAVNVLGFFMYEDFVGLGGDVSIVKLYVIANRIIDMSEIKINHIYHSNSIILNSPDLTAYEMRKNSWDNPVALSGFDVSKDAEKLKNYIFDRNR